MFLRHEGFLGALGAFASYERHGFDDLTAHQLAQLCPRRESCSEGTLHSAPHCDVIKEKKTL